MSAPDERPDLGFTVAELIVHTLLGCAFVAFVAASWLLLDRLLDVLR